MDKWTKLADRETVDKIMALLKSNNIEAYFIQTSDEVRKKVLEMLPEGTRILTGQSQTLEKIGLSQEIENSSNLVSVRKEYEVLDREKDSDKIRILRSTPDVIIGSVHAVTKDGKVMTASNTGSQLADYASSAKKVIWVVGAQKIVENIEEGFKRIYEHSLPLESERLNKLFGVPSNVSKILIVSREPRPGRTTLIFVNEVLGF